MRGQTYKVDYDHKTYLNCNDLVRICKNYNKCAELAEICGYVSLPGLSESWYTESLLRTSDISEIVTKINDLQYVILSVREAIFDKFLKSDHLNTWERALWDIENRLIGTAHQWRYSGEVISGDKGGIL